MNRRHFTASLASALAGLSTPAHSIFWSNPNGNAVRDPYSLDQITVPGFNVAPNCDLTGKTQVKPSTISPVNIAIFGNSVSNGDGTGVYVVTQTDNYNFNVCDGGCYVMADPPLGQTPTNGSLAARLGDAIRSAGTASIMIAPCGQGGSKIADWASGNLTSHATAVARRLSAVGFSFNAAIIIEGANDTPLAPSQAAYAASQSTFIASLRANGFAGTTPILICQNSQNTSVQSVNIRAAQAAAWNHPLGIWEGIDTDSYAFQGDGTHHTAAANVTMATDLKTKLQTAGVI